MVYHSISQKILQAGHFVVGWPTIFKHLPDISFDNDFQKIVLSRLLLFSCTCYQVGLDDIQWNEVATSTARSFNNTWFLYLQFSYMISLCPNIWLTKNSKCQEFLFWRKSSQKNTNFFKGSLFRNGWLYWYGCWLVLRDLCGLSKKYKFATFHII